MTHEAVQQVPDTSKAMHPFDMALATADAARRMQINTIKAFGQMATAGRVALRDLPENYPYLAKRLPGLDIYRAFVVTITRPLETIDIFTRNGRPNKRPDTSKA